MERFKCHACAFSFTEADKIWDSVKLTGRCPKCSEPLHGFPIFEIPQSIAASAQPGATQVEDQFCSNCGVPAAATAKFCAKCGAVLNTIQATTAPTFSLPNRHADNTAQSQLANRVTRPGAVMTDLPKEEAGSSEARWVWAVVLIISLIATVMFERESFTYALGNTIGGITLGFLLSPIWWLISKPFAKFKWRWYHWFNSATITDLVTKIGYWVLVPIAKSTFIGG